jgi:LPXTG-motif cell wall-anchored protein
MRLRHGLAPAAAALALAVPGQALAQGAGDDQYTDPFGSDQATPTATPRPRATAAPQPATPQPPAAPAAAPAAPAVPAGPAAAAGPELPYTGSDAWVPGLSGILLLGTGAALRLRLREPD